jgi:F0F1-type ATP synthase assembly protein I
MNITDLSSRKFILTILCGILVSIAFFLGKLGSTEWLGFLITDVLGYGVLNILDKPNPLAGTGSK